MTPGGANDYPKLGVWDDDSIGSTGQSAYTFTLRDFGGTGGPFSVSAGVMDRDAMLAGVPTAGFVKFSNPCTAADCIEGQLPPHLAGPPPLPGTCPTYWTAIDEAYDDSPYANDGYRNHTLCVDWSILTNSTYTEGPLVVAGSNFDRFLGNGFSGCISPVNGGEPLDCLANFTMYRAQYRWFGDNARVVLNTTVDAGNDRAGIRWAETRSANGDSGWFLQQDGTYAPADGLDRWMGSIAQDQDGNIALGYSASGASLFPAVRYASRMGGDILGTLPGGEVSCHEGTGAQIASAGRWGDYSSMSVDPTDDCTFWYTQEYYEDTGSFDFKTNICSFTFPDCGQPCVADGPEVCDDGIDNDCNGDFDCADAACGADEACACQPEPEICDNGVDDDCDGFVDCDDADCDLDPICLGPENDFCADAIEIVCPDGGGSVTVSGSTIDATFDGAPFCGTSNTAPGVWYKVVLPADDSDSDSDSVSDSGVQLPTILTASTCNQANFDTKLSVYDGTCDGLECLTGNDDTSGCSGFTTEVQWASEGPENLILVHGFANEVGDFDLTVTCSDPIEGDFCEDSIGPLAVGSVTSGSTTDATPDEPPDIDCGTSVTAPGVWYTVEGTGNTMTASTCNDGNPATGGANYDTKISVYCADCEVNECIGGQDDDNANCSGFSTQFSWPTNPGQTYNVFVHGFGTGTGDFDLAILDDGEPVGPGDANDCDGVAAFADLCPDTLIPESVPTRPRTLKKNRYALVDGDLIFDTDADTDADSDSDSDSGGGGPTFTTEDTAGCSCEQILDELGLPRRQNRDQRRYGCTLETMNLWVDDFASEVCGDCLIANGTPGCQNGDCEAAVCAVDPFCCDVFWDGLCAFEADTICVDGGLCVAPALPLIGPMTVEGGRAFVPEPLSKDPNLTPPS